MKRCELCLKLNEVKILKELPAGEGLVLSAKEPVLNYFGIAMMITATQ